MLWRSRDGAFSLYSTLFNVFRPYLLLCSPFSSNSSPNIRKPKSVSRNPRRCNKTLSSSLIRSRVTPITHEFRYDSDLLLPETAQISDSASSDVTSICSILFNSSGQTRDLDYLLRTFKDKLSSNLVLNVLMNYRQLGRMNTLEFFSWAGFQLEFSFDDSVIEYVADYLGRRKLFDDLKCLLITIASRKGRVSCQTISSCIRFLGRQGRITEALCLFEELESLNCKPDNLVFNNMLYVLCKKQASEDLIDVALTVFKRIESPDTYSYSNILVGLCKFDRLATALEVFYEMGKIGLVPTRTAINSLIGKLCDSSTKEECTNKVKVTHSRRPFTILIPKVDPRTDAKQPASEVFWAIHDLGLLPSAFIIIQLISELCRVRKVDEAIEILKVVENKKLKCVDEGYSVVIQALCEVRRVDEACQLFGRMVSEDLKPKLVVYNSIICILCKLGSVVEAGRLFEIMKKKRCHPDNVTYTALIHAYGRARNWEIAYKLFLEMLGLGWCPHFHTYNLVDNLLKEHGRVDLSLQLERKLEIQLLHKDCKEGRLEAAYEKLSSMLEKGFYPPIYTKNVFERAFQKSGKLKIARELLERMDQTINELAPQV